MAYFSSSSPSTWKYGVFASFHVQDVSKTFLNRLRKQLDSNEITMFDDSAPLFFDDIPSFLFDDSAPLLKKQRSSVFHQRIERSPTIASELTQAIRESRISIIVLSKNYASSSKCLDELLEILNCKKFNGQRVTTVFYGVDPSDVQKQTGDFGIAFNETCAHKTEEERRRWRQALNDVGNIAGEHFLNWDNESKMIEKISRDMSNELNTTISRDFGDMVGLETHLKNIESLLHLDKEDEAMIVGIYGPAGIGKTIIARASYSRFSSSFQLTCFMGSLRGSYNSGLDEYSLKLGVKRERLWDQKVLIILDNVDDLKQLEAWANEIKWFGPGSRIVVTTEDQELLQKHGINDTYHVDFPSSEEALQILCRYAFGQRSPHNGFTELAKSVVDLCGNLPSRLSEVGSSLYGRKEEEWEKVISRLALSNKRKSISIGMAFLVVINLLLEITSAVVEHLSSIQKPYFTRISVVMSFLSVVLSILDLIYKIRAHKACFRCKWPIPWFYYPDPGYNRISGNFTDTVLMFCAVGGSIVSTVNWSYIEKRREGPIKASVWPLFFAIGLVGMVVYKFIQEKLAISKDNYSLEQIRID